MKQLDAEAVLRDIASRIPRALRTHVVVIGSIATAWAFRDVSHTAMVATKDIDLLLRPAVDAVATAQALGDTLLSEGWTPQFPHQRQPGNSNTPNDELPALRLAPPGDAQGWFVELLAEPPAAQTDRRQWRRFRTQSGFFGVPSFRFMPIAIHNAPIALGGLRVALPACMALAHLLEHAQPDRTPIGSLANHPPRFTKDVGRAVSLWWLANRQSPRAPTRWQRQWQAALRAHYPTGARAKLDSATAGLQALDGYLRDAHQIAMNGVLAPHGTTLEAFQRAWIGLADLLQQAR